MRVPLILLTALFAASAVLVAACDDESYAPPRQRDSQRKDFDFRALAGAAWDSLGFLRPHESCRGHGWSCPFENPSIDQTLAVVWKAGEEPRTVRMPHDRVQPDPSVTPVLRPSQRLCYIDSPEPWVLLYPC